MNTSVNISAPASLASLHLFIYCYLEAYFYTTEIGEKGHMSFNILCH